MSTSAMGQLGGTILAGRYRLGTILGDGGMGRVYLGTQLSTGNTVAVKVLDTFNTDADTIKRFEHEARTTASLHHPNTVRVLDFGIDGRLFFLVMERLEGVDLTGYLRRGGQPDGFVIHLLHQVACSLAEAHSHGLVHRDIKPSNIMITHHQGLASFVKVIDFGIARAAKGPGHGTLGILGTQGYMSPEYIGKGSLDVRSDLYSLGCVAYELSSGRLPFEGITAHSKPMEILEAHLAGRPTPLIEAKPSIDPRLADLVMQLLSKEPDQRPSSAAEIIELLEALKRELTDPAQLKIDVSEAPAPVEEPARPQTAAYSSPGQLSSALIPGANIDAVRDALAQNEDFDFDDLVDPDGPSQLMPAGSVPPIVAADGTPAQIIPTQRVKLPANVNEPVIPNFGMGAPDDSMTGRLPVIAQLPKTARVSKITKIATDELDRPGSKSEPVKHRHVAVPGQRISKSEPTIQPVGAPSAPSTEAPAAAARVSDGQDEWSWQGAAAAAPIAVSPRQSAWSWGVLLAIASALAVGWWLFGQPH